MHNLLSVLRVLLARQRGSSTKLLSSLRVAATFAAALCVLYAIPPGKLTTPNAISGLKFMTLFTVPAVLAVAALLVTSSRRKALHPHVLTVAAAICNGIALALGLYGLLTVHAWYGDPGKPHLEPLVVMLGFAAAAAETCSRRIRTLLNGPSKDLQARGHTEGEL